MKKIEYPNRGHVLSDFFIDGISRVYEHEENVVMTLESPTGIETPNAILKNESVRLVIPKSQFNNILESMIMIKEKMNLKDNVCVPSKDEKKDDSFLGSAFNVSD